MRAILTINSRVLLLWVVLPMLHCAGLKLAYAVDTEVNSAEALRNSYQSLQEKLNQNQFKRPVVIDSNETSHVVTGNIHAVLNTPFSKAGVTLASAKNWCDILFLHMNTKYCSVATDQQDTVLHMRIGKKYDQPLEDAYELAFKYRPVTQTPNYLLVELNADEGPLNTSDYRIVLEAIPLDNGKTFLHLSYAYSYGLMGRMAMQTYFSTVARKKIGFTMVDKQRDGGPQYVTGMRGIVERNTMRYYLAIEAFLATPSGPAQQRLERQLRDWYAATERYPKQLHEVELNDYLATKRSEYRRQVGDKSS